MRIALVFVVGCFAVMTVSASPAYTTKYDNVKLDEILSSDRLLTNYINCLLDKGKCTPDGKELKEHLPDAINNKCSSCSEKQEEGATKVIQFLVKNKPQIWAELTKKYDPEGKHKDIYPTEDPEKTE